MSPSSHIVDAAGTEGRDPIADIYAINKELESYNADISKRPQVIAANKIDAIYSAQESDPLAALKAEFEPKGIPVYPISAISGQGLKELLYHVREMLDGSRLLARLFKYALCLLVIISSLRGSFDPRSSHIPDRFHIPGRAWRLFVIIETKAVHSDSVALFDAQLFQLLQYPVVTQEILEKGETLFTLQIGISQHFFNAGAFHHIFVRILIVYNGIRHISVGNPLGYDDK